MSRRDPAVTALLIPQLALRLQEQSMHLEHAVGALRAVSELFSCSRHADSPAFVGCDQVNAGSMADLAAALSRAVEVPLREIDSIAAELEGARGAGS